MSWLSDRFKLRKNQNSIEDLLGKEAVDDLKKMLRLQIESELVKMFNKHQNDLPRLLGEVQTYLFKRLKL